MPRVEIHPGSQNMEKVSSISVMPPFPRSKSGNVRGSGSLQWFNAHGGPTDVVAINGVTPGDAATYVDVAPPIQADYLIAIYIPTLAFPPKAVNDKVTAELLLTINRVVGPFSDA
jgi:hypothetical protein